MEELARAKAIQEAERALCNEDATEKIRTVAHLFPNTIPIIVENDSCMLFYDAKTKVNITISVDLDG